MSSLGKWLIIAGIGFIAAGIVVCILSRWTAIGRLPGDIFIKSEHGAFYFPIVSCLIISIVLSILLNLFHR